jgi:hypothetical protein
MQQIAWVDTESGECGERRLTQILGHLVCPLPPRNALARRQMQKYGDKGLVMLGASVDDAKSQPEIQPFAKPIAFFDGDGRLVARLLGELDKSELEHRIEWIARQTSRQGTGGLCERL